MGRRWKKGEASAPPATAGVVADSENLDKKRGVWQNGDAFADAGFASAFPSSFHNQHQPPGPERGSTAIPTMNISKVFRLCAAALAAGAFSLIVGCETESAADATITVTPVHAELTAANPSITLKASGGWDYIWNLNNSAAGYLNKTTGASVTYTAVQFGGDTNAVEQVVTVSGMGGATNAASASARITLSQK